MLRYECKKVYNVVNIISHEIGEFIMTIAEKLINEGIEKGKIENYWEIAIEMKKERADIKFISKVTKIPIGKLNNIFKI